MNRKSTYGGKSLLAICAPVQIWPALTAYC